jgi:hypothetical protein
MRFGWKALASAVTGSCLTWACGGSIDLGSMDLDGAATTATTASAPCNDGGSEPWTPLLTATLGVPDASGPCFGCPLAPGSEALFCFRQTVTADTYLRALRVTNPPSTVAALLGVGAPSGADGFGECPSAAALTNGVVTPTGGASSNQAGVVVFSSTGPGSTETLLPDGYAIHVAAGQQFLLVFQAFNPTSMPFVGPWTDEALLSDPQTVTSTLGTLTGGPPTLLPGLRNNDAGCF